MTERTPKLKVANRLGPALPTFMPGNEYHKLRKNPQLFTTERNAAFTPEQQEKRSASLLKAWNVKAKINAGRQVMTVEKKQRKRNKHWKTIAKEAREIQQRAREHAWMGIEELASLIRDAKTPAAVKVTAIALMHDRAYGKPSQTNINAEVGPNAKPEELTAEQLDRRIEEAVQRVEELTRNQEKAAPCEDQPADVRKLH